MKITLKNLHEATAQQVFDQVAEHLLTQMEQSKDGPNCVYRGPEGLKCAAGCLIGDDEYIPKMDMGDGTSWDDLINKFNFSDNHWWLISRLQEIHDLCQPEDWHRQLKKLSKEFNLEWKF